LKHFQDKFNPFKPIFCNLIQIDFSNFSFFFFLAKIKSSLESKIDFCDEPLLGVIHFYDFFFSLYPFCHLSSVV
ncbi:hypothetical protein, partial [Vibrio cholerae]|uniref:hypothetical protein n=1 Tax=Vibrio cholerae TaxID=666 RepID=UPI001F47C90D